MHVFIRHAEKEYDNKTGNHIYQFDSPLTKEGMKKCHPVFMNLIKKFGVPDKIIISPYLRARQTYNEMIKGFPEDIPMEIDAKLSEYLGFQKLDSKERLCPETLEHDPPPSGESMKDFRERVQQIYDNLCKNKKGLYFYVTHGYVITLLMEINNTKFYKPVEPLGYRYLICNK